MAKITPKAKPVADSDASKRKGRRFGWKDSSNKYLLYGRTNYILFALGFVMVLVGFALMAGGGSDDPNVFDAEALYAFRRLTLAPIVIVTGFLIIAAGTLIHPKNSAE